MCVCVRRGGGGGGGGGRLYLMCSAGARRAGPIEVKLGVETRWDRRANAGYVFGIDFATSHNNSQDY